MGLEPGWKLRIVTGAGVEGVEKGTLEEVRGGENIVEA